MNREEEEALKRALERERSARKLAEKILEERSSELYHVNQLLSDVNASLEESVEAATKQIELVARFPAENPFPVIRTDRVGESKYLNDPAQKLIDVLEAEGIDTDILFTDWAKEAIIKKGRLSKELDTINQNFLVEIVPISEHSYVNFYFSETTRIKIAESEIIRSEEKYRSVIENMQLGLLELNTQNEITEAYSQFCSITGYQKHELLGQSIDELLVEENKESIVPRDTNSLQEVQIKKKDGNLVWVLISNSPLFNEKGQSMGSIGIHLDISEQKENERELKEAKFKAEESTRAKEQFLANMSHEIRTPLNAISGMTELLLKSKIDKEQNKLLTAMDLSSQNLLVVINDILDFSKIESGKLKFEKIGFRLNDVIKHVFLTKKMHSDEKEILLEYAVSEDVGEVMLGDPFRLNQILLNFVNNAIKFTSKGSVKIIVESLSCKDLNEVIKFNIIDTGKGIEPNKLETIFEPFHQEDASITRSYGGTGLGLTITKKMIEMQGGQLSVCSKINEGSDFEFTIPYERGTKEDLLKESFAEVDTSLLEGLKILMAEDNEFNQILMSTMFNQFNVDLTIVDNGEKAIEELNKQDFDVVLMDIQMPVIGGVEATIFLREQERHRDLPIIALTANAFKEDLDKYKEVGMSDCLSKPFKSDELFGKILQLTNRKNTPSVQNGIKKTEEQLYDLKHLFQMFGGNKELVIKMVSSFLKHTPPLLEELFQAADSNDLITVSKICHRLKASYKTMSIRTLETPIHLLEVEIQDLDKSQIVEMLSSIRETSNKVFENLSTEDFHKLE